MLVGACSFFLDVSSKGNEKQQEKMFDLLTRK